MAESFFERPILTSPYEYPARHWELDESGHPTNRIVETRRRAEFITPIPGSGNNRIEVDPLDRAQGRLVRSAT